MRFSLCPAAIRIQWAKAEFSLMKSAGFKRAVYQKELKTLAMRLVRRDIGGFWLAGDLSWKYRTIVSKRNIES